MKEILDIIHNTIYQFFDVCGDDEEVPMSDKDKLLLEVNKAICNNIKALDRQPKTGHWIPVSERLPEEDGEYLLFGKMVEDEENNIFIGDYDSCGEKFGIWEVQYDRSTLGCLGSEFYEYASVIEWMPLPTKPYKVEREET